MDRYKVEISELSPKRARNWLPKTLKENEKFSIVSHVQYETKDGKVRNVIIFEDPLLGLMSHLETQDSLLEDDEE